MHINNSSTYINNPAVAASPWKRAPSQSPSLVPSLTFPPTYVALVHELVPPPEYSAAVHGTLHADD